MKPFRLARPPRRVLVVCMRRIGDVLTVTPLLASLRRAWPEARIEVLVPASTAAVLAGNPDIDAVRVEPAGPLRRRLRLLASLWRRYDLAVGTQYNDRPWLYTLAAAARRVMVVPHAGTPGARLKRWLADGWCELSLGRTHAVEQYLALAEVLGLPRHPAVVPPQSPDDEALRALLGADWALRRWAVVHPTPMYRYKAWTTAGWASAIQHLTGRHGLEVVLSGGPAEADRQQAAAILEALDASSRARVTVACGRLDLGELALLLQRAAVYLGPDTSITHLAAASGTRTLALFGPSHPIAWGPWPQGGVPEGLAPWEMKAALQRRERIWLIQGEGDCVPCLAEGCDRHLGSRAACLETLAPERVHRVVDQALLDDAEDPPPVRIA